MATPPTTRLLPGIIAVATTVAGPARADDPTPRMNLWNNPEAKSGKVTIQRDEHVFAAKPASMLLDMRAEPTEGSIGRGLAVTTGSSVDVSLRVRMGEGMKSVFVAVNLIGEGGGSHPVLALTKQGDWQAGAKSVPVPEGIGMAFLSVSFEGQGEVWIDDIEPIRKVLAAPRKLPFPQGTARGQHFSDGFSVIEGALDVAGSGKLNAFGMPFGYAYGSFEKHVTVADGVAHVEGAHGRGGAGFICSAD